MKYGLVMLIALLVVGCSTDGELQTPEQSPFMLYISVPDDNAATTRSAGDPIFADREFEKRISSLDVWVFKTKESGDATYQPFSLDGTNGEQVGWLYKHLNKEEIILSGGVKQVVFTVGKNFNPGPLDVYAIANIASVRDITTVEENNFMVPGDQSTDLDPSRIAAVRSWLENELYLSGDEHFSFKFKNPNNPGSLSESYNYSFPTIEDMENENYPGLPMSGKGEGLMVKSRYEMFVLDQIQIKRAVAKLRIVVARTADMTDVSIERLFVRNIWLPKEEYLFREGTELLNSDPKDIRTPMIPKLYAEDIAVNPIPWSLDENPSNTGQKWEDNINQAIKAREASEVARYYMRETKGTMKIILRYKLSSGGSIKGSANDSSPFIQFSGGIPRNKSLTIYLFFANGAITYEVSNWDQQSVTYPDFY